MEASKSVAALTESPAMAEAAPPMTIMPLAAACPAFFSLADMLSALL